MSGRLRDEILRGKIYAVDLFDGLGGSCRFYISADNEKAAVVKVLRSIIKNQYYHVEELADPQLDTVED